MGSLTIDGGLRDFSAHDLHGLVSGTTGTPGARGEALQFSVATDRVELPSRPELNLDGPLSVAVWFRFDRTGQHQHLVACDDKFAVWLTPDDHVRFVNTLGDGAETTVPLSRDVWHSVIGVFRGVAGDPIDESNVEVWIDGVRASATVASRRFPDSPRWQAGTFYESDTCYIGFESHQGEATHQTLPFFGAIDEVQIYGRALTPRELQLLGQGGS
jgi:hypothetical protein